MKLKGLGRGLDARNEAVEDRRVRSGPAVCGVAGVQVQDGGTGVGRLDGLRGDLLGRDRQVGRHGGRVHRAGDRAGDDDFVGHAVIP